MNIYTGDSIMNQDKNVIFYLIKNNPYGYHIIIKNHYKELYAKIQSCNGKSMSEKTYNFLHDNIEHKCKYCCSNKVKFKEVTTGYFDYCSNKCAQKSDDVTKIREDAIFNKYGVNHYTQTQEYKEKSKKTCLEKYGVEYSLQSEIIKSKSKNTYLQKYNVINPAQNAKIKEKMKETNMRKYGVEYPHQSSIIFDKVIKSRYKLKDFTYPSGKTIKIQGYEHYAIRDLLNHGVNENDIITDRNDMPILWYFTDGKRHRYYPDIYIKTLNKIIEVKSDYTYQVDLTINMLKHKCSNDAGFIHEFYVYKRSGTRVL
jgi:hypothetical protein